MTVYGMPTPNYILTDPVSIPCGKYDTKVLPYGTFVRPIEYAYLPKHVIEDERWRYFNKDTDVFCYCYLGIVPVPKSSMRKV